MKLLFNFKPILLSLTLIVGLSSLTFAQWDEGVAAIVKVKTPPKVKVLVAQHLKAITSSSYEAFQATYGYSKDWNDTMLYHFEVITSGSFVVTPGFQKLKANPPLGFNLGVILEKGFMIIVVPSQTDMQPSNRLPHDILGVSAELGAGLRKQGVNTSKSMAFLVNTRSMRIMDAGSWNRQLKN